MTSAILRRNSSKQGLQKLIRLTAQWSAEDEEEAARERRRRERERQLRSQAEEGSTNPSTPSETGVAVQESRFDGKLSGTSELEEDEGFSDWSQKLEQRKQKWAAGEVAQEGEQKTSHSEWREDQTAGERSPGHCYDEDTDSKLRDAEIKLEQVHLGQESPTIIQFRSGPSNFLRFVPASFSQDQPEEEAELEELQKLSEPVNAGDENQYVPEKNKQEEEEENQYVPEKNKQEEEENQYYVPEKNEREEEERGKQEDKKRRWSEVEETPEKRQRAPSTSSLEEENQAPLSPTMKITDRTESLNRSIKKSNSVKKTQPPLPVSKIDDRVEQYTHAIETSNKTSRPARLPSIDIPANSAAVSSTKSLWETGEVVAQSPVRTAPCKDIVGGDIVNMRSIWEQKDNSKEHGNVKNKSSGKKYKFVAIGHGQYKKVLIDDAATE